MNPFNIHHSLNTSYNNELEPLIHHGLWCPSGVMVAGIHYSYQDQETLREAIANECWDYEDSIDPIE